MWDTYIMDRGNHMQDVSKSTVARLLATENITVVQDKVRTAMFDVKNRVLTLPMWKDDMSPETTDHLIGHEVGHALYTPLDGWHDAVCENGPGYKSFLNVVEDARIEKLIQRKYPGLRRSFITSYKSLLAGGFFGADIDTINTMPLIDRINTYFKCGLMSGVKFTDAEQQWLPRIESAETWDEVVAIVDELYGLAKEEMEQQQQQQNMLDEGDEEDNDDDWGDIDAEGEVTMQSDLDMDDDGDDAEDDTGDGESGEVEDADAETDDEESVGGNEGGQSKSEPKSSTDEELRDSIDREMNTETDAKVHNLKLARITNSEDYIITYKDIFKHIDSGQYNLQHDRQLDPENIYDQRRLADNIDTNDKHLKYGEKLLDRWRRNNQKSVNTLVKEFEMRKSAAEYARANIAKTGVIDTVKMNKYKLTDDIFRKVTVIPEGKNHGFIMYLDMSGSMNEYMFETVEQTIMLANFCKQVGVPFRVFGFTDALFYGDESHFKGKVNHNDVTPDVDMRLLELFSEKMNKMEMTRMSKHLLAQFALSSKALKKADYNLWYEGRWINQINIFRLGGTPLNSALSVGIDFANKFRKTHRLDVINTVLLTDGESHGQDIANGQNYSNNIRSLSGYRETYITLSSPYNNKTYRLNMKGEHLRMSEYDLMSQIYKDATGSVMVGYKIISNGSAQYGREIRNLTGAWDQNDTRKTFMKDGYTKLDNVIGHDEMYVISVKSLTPAPNKLDDVAAGASKSRIRSAFKASGQGSKRTRKMLIDLAKLVA